ncbi:hypothetical protein [Kineosporia sp. R_H_3]|uniref:hypothetical protein n=1 Tax=Kineosporia sp. R_H_3 TaxID=1961848 RepID=UPI000B4B4829|nr:hypothetical protein [Kineosporia sp. R_H_3]
MPVDESPAARPDPDAAPPDPLVPEHLAAWYPGDLEQARAAHAGHTPSGLPAHRDPAPHPAPEHEETPAEGGEFLASWYAGDLGAAARARRDHDEAVRQGRTSG